MKLTRFMRFGLVLILSALMFGPAQPGQAATARRSVQGSLPPVLLVEDEFEPEEWTVAAVAVGGATYSVTQQLTGGHGSPAFRWMSHRIPPVTGGGLNSIAVTHVYTAYTYDPGTQGALTAIDYSEAGRILSYPWPEAFSTTQPVVVQDGEVYRSPQFLRFIAENSTHAWEFKSLSQLTAADFIRVDGSETDHPDFSTAGSPLQFGFTRNNSRSSTLPPVPGDQDLVIEQGMDTWRLILHRDYVEPPNQPPQAVDDTFILNGYNRSLPLFEFLNVAHNDSDPDRDFIEVISVTEPLHGLASPLGPSVVYYELEAAEAHDTFEYTLSDDEFTDTARVHVLIDCACTVLCLNSLDVPEAVASGPSGDSIDLALMYAVRDQVLKPTPHGQRYVEMYYASNPEILLTVMLNEALRTEAVAVVELWQPNLANLVWGDGSALITQAQVDAVESFLLNLSAGSSPALQTLISEEMQRLGDLDGYVGLTMKAARTQAIGDPTLYLPQVER